MNSDLAWGLLYALLGVVGAVVVGAVIIMSVRRWARSEPAGQEMTLQNLRDLRARGEITELEYERMRDRLAGVRHAPRPRQFGGHPDAGRAPPPAGN
ncbi:MAG: SHOCT domain-containing protein [Phycisphaerales bacterium]|nr:SHOCT domain-containing protein [Phycisphaerales bacterium]